MPTFQKLLEQLLAFLNLYQHAENQFIPSGLLIPSKGSSPIKQQFSCFNSTKTSYVSVVTAPVRGDLELI